MSRKQRMFAAYLSGPIVIALMSGCATRLENNVHPYRDHMFQAPLAEIDQYKSTQARPVNEPELSVAVAISGGGERAANFAAGVLLELENIPMNKPDRNALQELDYFSTVSGGGMAVAAYYSALYSHIDIQNKKRESFSFNRAMEPTGDDLATNCRKANFAEYYAGFDKAQQITDPCLRRHLERGYHGNIASALFRLKTLFSNLDRGDALENTFARELAGENWNGKQLKLGELFVPTDGAILPTYPQWLTNATVLENGAIFPFTPDILDTYHVSSYTHKMESVSKADDTSHFDFALQTPLSLGLTASGNFPSLITPQTLKSDQDQTIIDGQNKRNGFIHLIDGGVSDNLGLFTALSVLSRENPPVKHKVLIVIDAYPGNFSPYSRYEGGPNFLTVYSKLSELPLDGVRGRAREYIRQAGESVGVKVFYLSFDELYRPGKNNPYVEDPQAVAQLFEEIRRYYPVATALETDQTMLTLKQENLDKSPFQIARKVKTSYNITRAEQEFLIAVGRYLVAQSQDGIKAAMLEK